MTKPLNMDLLDYIAELTQPHTHREHYTVRIGATTFGQDHTTKVPPLLHQLRFASPSGQGEERSGGGYESRPAASVDAISTLTEIDKEASRWVRVLGEDDPVSTIGCVRLLNGLAAGMVRCKKPHRGCCDYHSLEHDVRRWWAQARVSTGWDSPAWRPDNTCPMCSVKGSLRVKLVDHVAVCTDCRETWDKDTIGLLAEHIRAESAGLRPVREPVFCWCAWPSPPADSWPSLCPHCASPWCHRAGWAQAIEGPVASPEHPHLSDLDGRMGA